MSDKKSLGREATGHAAHHYISSFDVYRTITHADDGTTGYALTDITQVLDLSSFAREGVDNEIVVAVNGASGCVLKLYAFYNNVHYYVGEKAATTVANQLVVFTGLPALKYKIAATSIGAGTTVLIAGGTQ